MAVYPTLSLSDLSTSTGKDEEEFSEEFAATSLINARLFFKIATCRKGEDSFPEDPDEQALARNAILAMAEHLHQGMKFADITSSPFNSETIGSYSYSKKAQAAITAGEPTGVMWFDLAVTELSLCSIQNSSMDFGGIEVFEHDGYFEPGVQLPKWVGPADGGGYPR